MQSFSSSCQPQASKQLIIISEAVLRRAGDKLIRSVLRPAGTAFPSFIKRCNYGAGLGLRYWPVAQKRPEV